MDMIVGCILEPMVMFCTDNQLLLGNGVHGTGSLKFFSLNSPLRIRTNLIPFYFATKKLRMVQEVLPFQAALRI